MHTLQLCIYSESGTNRKSYRRADDRSSNHICGEMNIEIQP